ncbi:isochorismatase family protein [Streptomyces griseoluteus]|uniref:isochorismatase family protein n=1 Tax=Streptomyces griseoluteus TaxID=29306 RepID=UPI00368B3BB7
MLSDAYDVKACLRTVADLGEQARSAGVPVIYLRQRLHDVPAGLIDVHPALAPQPGDVVLDKDSADSFLDTGLGDLLDEQAVCRVIVTGFAAEYCVDSASRGALSRGYDLVLVSDGHTTPERPPVQRCRPLRSSPTPTRPSRPSSTPSAPSRSHRLRASASVPHQRVEESVRLIGRTRGRRLRCGDRPGRWWRSSRSGWRGRATV